MPIIRTSKCQLFSLSPAAVVAATFLFFSYQPVFAVSFSDTLSLPESSLTTGYDQQQSGQDAINSALNLAEKRLKQGAWQETSKIIERVLAKETDNVKAHSILGLVAAFGGQKGPAEKELAFLKTKNVGGVYPELISAILNGQEQNYQKAQAHLDVVLKKEPNHPIAHYYSGSLQFAQGHLEQAEKYYKATLEFSPKFPPAHAGLGQIYWQKKQPEKAAAAYHKAVEAEPDTLLYRQQLVSIYKATGQKEAENKASVEMFYFVPGVRARYIEQGLELLHRGSYDEVINLANTLLGVYKKFPAGHYMKAVSLINTGQKKAAGESIANLLVNGSGVAKTHHEAGMCYLALGDLDKAEEQFKRVLVLEPSNGRSFVFLPIIEQLRGHRDSALNGLSLMLTQNENPSLIHYLRANNFLGEGQVLEYHKEIEKNKPLVPGMKTITIQALPPSDKTGAIAECRNLMVLYYLNGWYEQAAQQSTSILKTLPSDMFALWYNGLAGMAQKRYQDAISSLKKMVQLEPNLLAAHMELGQAHALINDMPGALASFKTVSEISPSYAPAYVAMGEASHRIGLKKEAIEWYRKAVQLNPNSLQSYQSLAILLAEKSENIAEAMKLANKAIELAPENPVSLDALGWIYIQQGQHKTGIEKLQKALKILPRQPEVMYHLGVGYYKGNQPEEAQKWLQSALNFSKNFKGRVEAEELLGNIAKR